MHMLTLYSQYSAALKSMLLLLVILSFHFPLPLLLLAISPSVITLNAIDLLACVLQELIRAFVPLVSLNHVE